MEIHLLLALLTGYLLDLALGDPRWMPHPIIAFGNTISWFEQRLNTGNRKFLKGMFTGITLPVTVFIIFYYAEQNLFEYNIWAWSIFSAIFLFFGLANKSLLQEASEVLTTLEKQGLEAGRKRLSWIVGRDTSNLSRNQIYTATFETVAENLSDGVIAPLFYYAIAGVPGIMTYKMINTLDSMIGYKSERYKAFGHFAAKVDDIANYIPARITALLMSTVTMSWRSVIFIFRYGNKHASPNAGYPESALAGILNCRFGGPNVYHGELVNKPYIGIRPLEFEYVHFRKVKYVNHASTILMVLLIILIRTFVY